MSMPCQVISPRGCLEVWRKLRGANVDQDHHKVLEGAKHIWKQPKSEEDKRSIDTNTLCQDRGLGAHRGKKAALGGIKGKWRHQTNGDRVGMDGTGCWMDNTMSGIFHKSKWVKMWLLAGNEEDQIDGTISRWPMHLSHPHHLLSTPYHLLTMWTHHIVMNNSRWDLEKSIPDEEGLTRREGIEERSVWQFRIFLE